MIDFQAVIEEIRDEVHPLAREGKIADSIPRLAHDPRALRLDFARQRSGG